MAILSASDSGLDSNLAAREFMLRPFTVPIGATDIMDIGAILGDAVDDPRLVQIGLFVDKLPAAT